MSNRSIGKLVSISNNIILAEMYEGLGNYVNTKDGIRFVGEIGSYVTIDEIGRRIVAEVISVEEKNKVLTQELSKPKSSRYVQLSLIGEIIDGNFCFGVSKMPQIFYEIDMISENDLRVMLELECEEQLIENTDKKTRALSLSIGNSVIFSDYKVHINIDRFFGFHFAVFGNTGAGKSNTVARIIQNVFIKHAFSAKGAKFIIFDSNGEYKASFEGLSEVNKDITVKMLGADVDSTNDPKIEIPVWALSADDWAILLHASEKTQIPILHRAIDIARIFFNEENNDNKVKNHIIACTVLGVLNSSDSSPSKADKLKAVLTIFKTVDINLDTMVCQKAVKTSKVSIRQCINVNYGQFFDIESLQTYCEGYIVEDIYDEFSKQTSAIYDLNQFSQAVSFAVLYEGSISSQRIQEYTSTLSTRIQALKDSQNGKIFSKTQFKNLDDYINDLIGANQVLNIDISSLDDSSCEVVTKVLTKLIFDYLKRKPSKASMPINLIIEEAHRFIKNEMAFGALGYNIFERVAKEGRKYGLLMGISSQRPSELSKTVVSQCSNFIIHRVQNPDDLTYIAKMVPYINKDTIERLTYLQTGHALVFGSAIRIPTLTKFEVAKPATDSHNARISEKWYVE